MRNLKKILALVLALMMVLSMMVTASATAFSDDETINVKYAEAVEVLSGLGVINGLENEDGSFRFDPTGELTRAQAAKIISYVKVGSLEEIEILADGIDFTFTDVPSWAKPFVAYAYNEGIINGRNATTYDCKSTITGYELGKMLLIAAGLADNEDFVETAYVVDGVKYTDDTLALVAAMNSGSKMEVVTAAKSNWKVLVASELKDNGIWNSEFVLSKKLTREEACYLTFNTLMASATLQNIFDLGTQVGTVVNNNAITAGLTTTVTTIRLADGTELDFAVETGLDELGRVFTVYYNDTLPENSTSFITYAINEESTDIVVSTAINTTNNGTQAAATAAVKALFGTKTAAALGTNVDYQGNVNAVLEQVGGLTTTAGSEAALAGTYVVYNNAVVSYLEPIAYDVEEVTVTITDADEGYYTVIGDATYVNVEETATNCFDVVISDEQIDWVGKVTTGSTAKAVYLVSEYGDFYSFEEVQTVVGKITKTDTDALYIDGVKYSTLGDCTGITTTGLITGGNLVVADSKMAFGAEYKFFLDEAGKIYAAVSTYEAPEAVDAGIIYATLGYSKVVEDEYNDYGEQTVYGGTYYFIQGVNSLGEKVEYLLAGPQNDLFMTSTWGDKGMKTIYTVETNVNALTGLTEATLAVIPSDNSNAVGEFGGNSNATDEIKTSNATIATKHYFADDVVFFYVDGNGSNLSVVKLEGKQNVKNYTYDYCGVKADANNNHEVKYVFIDGAPSTLVSNSDKIYMTGVDSTVTVPYTKADGTTGTAYVHVGYVNGEAREYLTNTATAVAAGFYKQSVDSTTGLSTFSGQTDIADGKLASAYKGLGTTQKYVAGAYANDKVDVNVANAKIVDLYSAATVTNRIDTVEEILAGSYKIAYLASNSGITLIYVIGAAH